MTTAGSGGARETSAFSLATSVAATAAFTDCKPSRCGSCGMLPCATATAVCLGWTSSACTATVLGTLQVATFVSTTRTFFLSNFNVGCKCTGGPYSPYLLRFGHLAWHTVCAHKCRRRSLPTSNAGDVDWSILPHPVTPFGFFVARDNDKSHSASTACPSSVNPLKLPATARLMRLRSAMRLHCLSKVDFMLLNTTK